MNIFERIKRRVTVPDQNAPLQKTLQKKYTPRLGDKVTHLSGIRGTVVGVGTIDDMLVLNVDCANGRKLRGIGRLEFTLSNGEQSYVAAPEAKAPEAAAPPLPGLKGEISTDSLLDEITR